MTDKIENAILKFWGNKEKTFIKDDSGLPSDKAIDISVENAVKDLMARTLKRKQGEGANGEIKPVIINEIKEPLRKLYASDLSEKDFDEWHTNTCENILKVLQEKYINTDGTEVHYGKAQKILNMTLKYLMCMDGAEKYEKKLHHCQMPLDSYTLEWIKRACKKYNEKNDKIIVSKMPSWSVMDYGDGGSDIEKGKYTYNFFVKKIREFSKKNYGYSEEEYGKLTPLQAEFLIWPNIQMELAAEAFIIKFKSNYCELNNKEKQEIKDMSLKDKLEMIECLLPKVRIEE